MSGEGITYFREVQKFDQWWLRMLVLLTVAYVWYSTIVQLFYGKSVGDNPVSDNSLIMMWLIVGVIFPVFINSLSFL